MQNYLFIGGSQAGLNAPVAPDLETVQLRIGVTDSETYIRDSLALGDTFVTVYRLESLSAEDALDRLILGFKAWVANRRGADRSRRENVGRFSDSPQLVVRWD